MKEKTEGAKKSWERYKYAALAALVGVGLLLIPVGKGEDTQRKTPEAVQNRELQQQMEEILSVMSGVGDVKVLLTVDSDGERRLAQTTELSYSGEVTAPEDYSRRSETVLVDGDSGEEAVVVRTLYPTYRGALVVCTGGDRAEVRLAVTEAVAALTGLTSDQITVAKWQ
jgi:stage III sporulation protein AG